MSTGIAPPTIPANMLNLLLIGAGGFFGAVSRYGLGQLVTGWGGGAKFPLGTLAVNLIGCLLIGIAYGFLKRDAMEETIAEELTSRATDLDVRQSALQGCLENLRPAQRDLIRHRYVHRTLLKEYAEDVGRSVGGLKVTLHRIRTALAACIEQKLASQEPGR